MNRLSIHIILLTVLTTAILNLSCFDMYEKMLDNMPENYRLSLFVNGVSFNKVYISDKNGDFFEASGSIP